MRFENSKQMYSYWLKLKGNRIAPSRAEIEPNDIRTLLADTFILEVNHVDRYIAYRLAGTRLCAAHGRELKGLGYLVLWREEDNLEVLDAITKVYSSYTPMVISHHGQSEQNRFMEYETLLVPLQPVEDGSTRILGICSPKTVAFWHGSEPVVTQRLRSVRSAVKLPANNSHVKLDLVAPTLQFQESGLATTEVKTSASGNTGKKVGHLTLLDGGKN